MTKPRARADDRPKPGKRATSDLKRLRNMTQLLIKKLERSLKDGIPLEEAELTRWQKTHDWLFGAKHSLTATLSILTDLMLLLDKAEPGAKEGAAAPEFSEHDVALVKAFIDKSTRG